MEERSWTSEWDLKRGGGGGVRWLKWMRWMQQLEVTVEDWMGAWRGAKELGQRSSEVSVCGHGICDPNDRDGCHTASADWMNWNCPMKRRQR